MPKLIVVVGVTGIQVCDSIQKNIALAPSNLLREDLLLGRSTNSRNGVYEASRATRQAMPLKPWQ